MHTYINNTENEKNKVLDCVYKIEINLERAYLIKINKLFNDFQKISIKHKN